MKKKTRRIYLDDDQLGIKCMQLQRSNTIYVGGDSSIFVPSENAKYIDIAVCRQWPDLENSQVVLMTPSEAAKTEMRRTFDRHLTRGHTLFRKSDMRLLDISPPIFWDGRSRRFWGYYVDLRSAYYNIYRWLWLDTLWPRGTGSPELRFDNLSNIGELYKWKPARNAVIGITRSTTLTTWQGDKVKDQPYKNYHLNPMLWMTVQKVLHDIAREALSLGAVYVATDGYVFKSDRGVSRFVSMLTDYDLDVSTIVGYSEIKCFGCYRVGGKKTMHFDRMEHSRHATGVHNVEQYDQLKTVDWLSVVRRFRDLED